MSNLNQKLASIAQAAVSANQKTRDSRSSVSKGIDVATNKSYANEDKKVAAAAIRDWQNKSWTPKIEAKLKQELKTRAPHLKPGTPKYQQTYDNLFNTNLKKLTAAKNQAYQGIGVVRKAKQNQRQLDNDYRERESIRNDTVGIQAASHAARDTVSAAAGALATGTSRALRAPLQLAADVGENDDGGIFDRGAKGLERYESKIKNTYQAYSDIQNEGSFTQKVALAGIEQVPSLAATFGVAGAAGKAALAAGASGRVAALSSYGATTAAIMPQAYLDGSDSTKQELEQATPEQLASAVRSKDIYKSFFDKNVKAGMSEDDAYAKARNQTISEIAEESGENVGLATIAISMLAPGVGSQVANRVNGGALTGWGQKVFNKLAAKADGSLAAGYGLAAANVGQIAGRNVVEEALQEGYTDKVAQQTAVDVGVKEAIDMEQFQEAVIMGGVLGGLMGGGMAIGGRGTGFQQAQDNLRASQDIYAQGAQQAAALQEQITAVSPRSPEGQQLSEKLAETKQALNDMVSDAESRGIPRSSLARRAPRIEPTNINGDFDGDVDGSTEIDEQDFENLLNPSGAAQTDAPTPAPTVEPILSEQELDAQDEQIAQLIAEQQQLDEAIEDGSSTVPLEESLAKAQAWYDNQRGVGQEGLSGVVARAAASESDAISEQQAPIDTTTSINDYIARQRNEQRQLDDELEQDALQASTKRDQQEIEQRASQRESDRAESEALIAQRAALAQPYEGETFDTTVMGADGVPFNLANFWDSKMSPAIRAQAIAKAFGGEVDQNVAKANWSDMPQGVQKAIHQWMSGQLEGVRKSVNAQIQQPQAQQELENKERLSAQLKDSALTSGLSLPAQKTEEAVSVNGLTMPSQNAPIELTADNPVINVPAPTAANASINEPSINSEYFTNEDDAFKFIDENGLAIKYELITGSRPNTFEIQPSTDLGMPQQTTEASLEGMAEQAPSDTVYKSKPAARAAMKQQNLNPEETTIIAVDGGWSLIAKGEEKTETVAPSTGQSQDTNDQVYKSKPAARSAMKQRKLDPKQTDILAVDGGWKLIAKGESSTTSTIKAEIEPQPPVVKPKTKAASPTKPPQSPVAKAETLPKAATEALKPAAEKSKKTTKLTEPVVEIEDFGEKITGARKDIESFYQKEITDADITSQPLSKIWPKKEIDAIEDTQMAALATVLRGTIPSKPRKGYKLERWATKVKNARGIMQQMLDTDLPAEAFISQLTQVKELAAMGYQAQLLAEVDRKQWSRVESIEPRIGYQKREDDGSYTPFVGFAVKIDKTTHVIDTEKREVSEILDKVTTLLAGEVKASALKFDLYSRGRGDSRSYFLAQASDKDKTPLIEFNDKESAKTFQTNNIDDLTELWTQHKDKVNVKKSDMRSNSNRDRIGPDHRGGQDVTTEQFMQTFGLRGGQFGNWVKQGANSKDRQNMLNDAYDAFMDLAGVLTIPPEAIGLGGKLAMSFGARGKGRAMAHYEPSQVIINLTKTNGAGSLAHEWFHALDNHFTSFRDDPNRLTSKESAYITYKPEPMLVMKDRNGKPSSMRITEARRKQIYEMNKNRAYLPENFMPDPNHKEGVRPQVEEVFADLVETLDESPMKARTVTIDKGAPDGYWSRIIERAARSFESYVIHKLEQQGARSDFLANVTPEDTFARNIDRYPYILNSEMAPVAEAFDNLFSTIDSRDSKDGKGKTLFSRMGQVKQAIDETNANPYKGATDTTPKQAIEVLQKRFGKETVAKLIKSGALRVRTLSDFKGQDGNLLITSDVEGMHYDGKVALIADNLTSDTIIPTLLHELGGHAGMQNIMSPVAYNTLMTGFDNLVKSGNKYAVAAKERAEASTDTETEARDEYIPYLLSEYTQATESNGAVAVVKRYVNRVVAAVRAWLKNTTGLNLQITPNDIQQLAEKMIKRIADQKASPMMIDGYPNSIEIEGIKNQPQPQFSQAPAPQSQVDAIRKQYENTEQWLKAPNGSDTNLNEKQWLQVRTPAFKEWFGDWENEAANASKVVDTNGEPQIMYHGSPTGETFNSFNGDDNGSIYTSSNRDYAANYANDGDTFTKGVSKDKKIFEVFVKASNYFDNTNSDHISKLADAILENNETSSAGNGEISLVIDGEKSLYSKEVIEFTLQDGAGFNWRFMKEPWTQKAIKALGYDGFSVFEGEGDSSIAAYDSTQIKSATDNTSTFDSTNPDIRYSRRYSNANQNEATPNTQERASSAVRLGVAATSAANAGTIRILRRHIATPQHVALLNPDFKKFTDNIQARLAYENHEGGKVQVHVPEIWQTRLLVGKRKEAIEKVQKALFDGTMADKVWTNDELVDKFKLTPDQIDLYSRMRSAINNSLGNMTVDTLSSLAKGTKLVNIETINRLKLQNLPPILHNTVMQKHMTDELERLDKGGLISKAAVTRMQGQLDDVFNVMDSVTAKFDQLIDQGYAPLMRFGNYAVEVRNKETGELDLFELYEGNDVTGPLAQWRAIRDLKTKYDLEKYTISKGTLNPDAFKQFTDKGLNPETVQLFASELGLDSDGAVQAYLKVAISDRSALKRLIHRKKIPGYSEDMARVVSAFVMSNARHSGRMLYNGEIENSIQKIKDGNLQGEAQNVFKNMEDPQEEYAGIRNTMFHWFMAFSPAFLLLNLTQPFTQTIPKLAAYSGAARAHGDIAHALAIVGKYSGKATWDATKWVAGKNDLNWKGFEDHLPAWVEKEDYLRMSREGHLDPQNIWMIRGLERGKTGIASGAWGGFENLAGWPAEVSEGINRRSTMIAAFKTAKRMGDANLKEKGFNSRYEFAVSMIQQTQGVYNKGNRSGLARGTGKLGQFGPLIMVFKQFTINYAEQMIRHGRDKEFKSLALMMLWQFGIAGMFGLPFVDDLRDILEGMLYRVFGKSFNLKDELENLMGKNAAQNLMYGVPSNNNPIDFYGRSSMGNLLPLTDFARPNEGDWGEVIGASSSFFENFYTASKYMSEGRVRDAVVVASPRYVKDAVNGYEIYTTGAYRNHKGDKVMDMSKTDGVIKGLGQFNPASNAKQGRERSEGYHMKNQIKHNQDRYALALAEAIYQEDDKRYDKIYEEMDAWNERNKEPYLIDIEKVETSADNRVEKKDFGSAERNEKALPNQLEEYLEEQE